MSWHRSDPTEKEGPCSQSVSNSSSIINFPCLMDYFYNDEGNLLNPSHVPGSMPGALGLS